MSILSRLRHLPKIALYAMSGFASLLVVGVAYGLLRPVKLNIVLPPDYAATCGTVPAPADRFVGLAFSGGGSRAAVFAAAGAAALHDAGILRQVTHVSSVSGGGFAAAYLALNPTPYCTVDLDGDAPQNCLAADIDAMLPQMSHGFFWDMEWAQVKNPLRLFSPSRRITSLQDALDGSFVANQSFAAMPDQPSFYFNTVSYDTADRFVFARQPIPHPGDVPTALPDSLRTLTLSTPGCPLGTPDDTPVSLAVTTSAAFPPLLGPLTIAFPDPDDGTARQFWHLGDGGVIENTGVDTLVDAALLAKAMNPALPAATIIGFNAGLQLDPVASRADRDPSFWSRDLARLVDVTNLRADKFRDSFIARTAEDSGLAVRYIKLNYLDADFQDAGGYVAAEDVFVWPASCDAKGGADAAEAMLREIPTDLQITPCHADLMVLAAQALVRASLRDSDGLGRLQ